MSAFEPPSVLFTLGNRQQVANALPVALELARRGVHCRLLSLDPFYGQGVDEALDGVQDGAPLPPTIDRLPLGVPVLDPPFPRRSMAGKWRAIRRHADALRGTTGGQGALVVGVDGAVERLFLADFRRAGRPSAILWDGMASMRPRVPALATGEGFGWALRQWGRFVARRTVLHAARRVRLDPFVPGLAPHTPVARIFTMGRFVAAALRDQGIPSPIEVTGLPRFRDLLRVPPLEPAAGRRVLYLTSAFLWHGDRGLDRCQHRDLDTLASQLPKWGWTLRVRLHPRERAESYAHLRGRPGVELSTGTALRRDAAAASVVVTAVSTAAAETLAMGRAAAVYLGAFPAALATLSLGAHPGIPVARTLSELLELLDWLESTCPPASLVDDFFAPGTPTSASRIAVAVAAGLGTA